MLLGALGNGPLKTVFETVIERFAADPTDIRLRWTLRHAVAPVVLTLSDHLAFPYLLSRGLLPAVGAAPEGLAQMLATRYAPLAFVLWRCAARCYEPARAWCRDFHDRTRDEKYRVGERLANLPDSEVAAGGGSSVQVQDN